MRTVLIVCFLLIAGSSHAQIIKTDYDTLQDYRIERIQLHLERFSKTYSVGTVMYFVGIGVAGIGLAQTHVNGTLVGIGGGLNIVGTFIQIAAHTEIRRAAMVRRNKPRV